MKGRGGSKPEVQWQGRVNWIDFSWTLRHTPAGRRPLHGTQRYRGGRKPRLQGFQCHLEPPIALPRRSSSCCYLFKQSLLKTMGCHMRSRRRCCSAWQHIHSLAHWLHQRSACQPAELRRASEAFLFALPMTANMPLKHPQELHGFAGFRPQSIPGCQKAQGSIGNEWSPR